MADFFGLLARTFHRSLTVRMIVIFLLSGLAASALRPFYQSEWPMPELVMVVACAPCARKVRPWRDPAGLSLIPTVSSLLS